MIEENTAHQWSVLFDSAIGRRSQTISVGMIVLLVIFALGALGFGVLLAYENEDNTLRIAITARQRLLTQQIAKASFQLVGAPDSPDRATVRDELLTAYRQFDLALHALRSGGEAIIGKDGFVQIKPVVGERAQQLIAQLDIAWKPVVEAAAPIAALTPAQQAQSLAQTLLAQNRVLLNLSEQLLSEVLAVSRQRQMQLQLAQSLCFLVALGDALLLLFLMLRRLRAARGGAYQRLILETVSAGICLVDRAGNIVAANSAAAVLFDRSIESLEGQTLPALDADNRIEHTTPEGRRMLAQVTRKPLPPPSLLDVITLQDITHHIEHAEILHTQAHHDPLTGLPNRRLFEDRIDVALAQATRVRQRVGIAVVDLDSFKPINDTLGHAAGDLVLQTIAQRLSACARAGDTVARLGGDEFVCLFTGIGGHEHLTALGQRLLESLAVPLEHAGHFLPLPASIGLAVFPDDAEEMSQLIARADAAMYEAKQQGGNCVRACYG